MDSKRLYPFFNYWSNPAYICQPYADNKQVKGDVRRPGGVLDPCQRQGLMSVNDSLGQDDSQAINIIVAVMPSAPFGIG